MARLMFALGTEGEVALVAATAKTVLQVVAPANQRVLVKNFHISFDGVSATAEPVVVQLRRQTTAGTMSAATPRKKDDDIATAIQSTGLKNATVEPTDGDILKEIEVHPQAGYESEKELMQEWIIGGGDRIAIKATAPAAVNCVASMECEE